jgi:hypothetical protein
MPRPRSSRKAAETCGSWGGDPRDPPRQDEVRKRRDRRAHSVLVDDRRRQLLLEWREVSGKGEIFSYTIARRARPPFQGHELFLIGLVTLDEGVNVMANIVHCGLEKIRIGLRVKPFWLPLANGTHLLMFEQD